MHHRESLPTATCGTTSCSLPPEFTSSSSSFPSCRPSLSPSAGTCPVAVPARHRATVPTAKPSWANLGASLSAATNASAESTLASEMAEYQNRSRSRAARNSGSAPSSATSAVSNRSALSSAASSRQVTPAETSVPSGRVTLRPIAMWRSPRKLPGTRPASAPPRGSLGSCPFRDSVPGVPRGHVPNRANRPDPRRRRYRPVQSYILRPYYQQPEITPTSLHLPFSATQELGMTPRSILAHKLRSEALICRLMGSLQSRILRTGNRLGIICRADS